MGVSGVYFAHAQIEGLHACMGTWPPSSAKMDVETAGYVYTSAVRVSRPAFEERPLWDGFRKSRVYVEVESNSRAERLNLRRPRLMVATLWYILDDGLSC